ILSGHEGRSLHTLDIYDSSLLSLQSRSVLFLCFMSQRDDASCVRALSERLLVASHKGQTENVVQLINKGARVAVTKNGRTPLHLAAYKGHISVVRILLAAGCDLDFQDDSEQTALHRAAVVGNADVISALVQEGCATDRQDKKAGHTALHLACQNAHAECARILLLGGSRPDCKNSVGDTCLHVCARYNHVTVIRALLGAICSVTERNHTVRMLLEAGADSRMKNNSGETALDQARENNNPEVALMLTKARQSYSRGRTVRKRRDKMKTEGRAQSVPRDDMLPRKDSESPVCDTLGSEGSILRTETMNIIESRAKRNYNKKIKNTLAPSDALASRENKEGDQKKKKSKEQHVCPSAPPPHQFKAFQLYTLYRGQDGKIMQAPVNGCRCEPLIGKLENQLMATKEEMHSEIQTLQETVNSKMGQMERRSRHQIKTLDKITLERVSAERIDSVAKDLKSWCLSRIQSLEMRLSGEREREAGHCSSLSPTCLSDTPKSTAEGPTSSSSSPWRLEEEGEESRSCPQEGADAYYLIQLDASPEIQNQSAPQSPCIVRPKQRSRACSDPHRSPEKPVDSNLELKPSLNLKKHGVHRTKNKANRACETDADLQAACFLQQRDTLHALEVTQHFFEAVTLQMERWYERKIEEARWQANQQAQADRALLLERITLLEEELRLLRTNKS
ncbi:hypothetical protein DNTS_032420, partial [Danionella cerebrum]